MTLPFLPGNTINKKLGSERFHKPQHFGFSLDEPILSQGKPGIGGEKILGTKNKPENIFSSSYDYQIPSWIAFDKKVLCFDSWYKESVVESRQETYRVHYCKIYFYLEDSTIQVIEPRLKNSGLTQGTVLRRHRILRDPADENSFWRLEDFNLGIDVEIYGKTYRIINCDGFTKKFLHKMGVKINDIEELPADPYNKFRSNMEGQMHPLKPYQVIDTLGQFLTHDKHVLRFYCYWDDTESLYGEVRNLVLHYYLADDTIEIIEFYRKNCGRDKAPVFLKRDKLPKNLEKLPVPGQISKRTVLNVFGPMGAGSRSILDSLRTGEYRVDFYRDSDLRIGNVLNVYGRRIVLVSCDEFTKDYYNQIYGLIDFEPIEYQKSNFSKKEKVFPPYTGFGTEEDSMVSCLMMELRPPFKDLSKFFEFGGCGYISNVLRFTAHIVSDNPIDLERRFVVSYFLSDDTFLIFENPRINSGFVGGKFMERQKVRIPNQPRYNTELSKHYSLQDLFIGNVLTINSFKFLLTNADEYAFNYMERNPAQFPFSDIALVKDKIRASLSQNGTNIMNILEKANFEHVDYEKFRSVVEKSFPSLVLQEIMTLARSYAVREERQARLDSVVHSVIESLRKNMWSDFADLQKLFYHLDLDMTGTLSSQKTSNALKSIKLPIHFDLLKLLIDGFRDEGDNIDYNKLIKAIDWRQNDFRAGGNSGEGPSRANVVNYKEFYHDCRTITN